VYATQVIENIDTSQRAGDESQSSKFARCPSVQVIEAGTQDRQLGRRLHRIRSAASTSPSVQTVVANPAATRVELLRRARCPSILSFEKVWGYPIDFQTKTIRRL
jgi:hypothetical protein